jgi:hypothetical protein
MSKWFQRKSFLSLVLSIAFVHCGANTKKAAADVPVDSSVAMANRAAKPNTKIAPLVEVPPTPDAPENKAEPTPAPALAENDTKSLIRPLSQHEQKLRSPVYIAPTPPKGIVTPEVKAKQDAAETTKRSQAAQAQIKRVQAAEAKRAIEVEAARLKKEEEDRKKAEEAAKKKAEEEATRKKIQDEMDATQRQHAEEQKKLQALSDSSNTLTDTTNTNLSDPATGLLPNDSTTLQLDTTIDKSTLPLLNVTQTDTALLVPNDTTTLNVDTTNVATPKADAPTERDNSGKRMTDVLEDLSESLLKTMPASEAEDDELDKVFRVFQDMNADFDSQSHRLENIFLMAKKNERFAKALQSKNLVQGSHPNEARIAGPLWYAFDIQAKMNGEDLDTSIIEIYRNKQQNTSTITVSTTHFPQDQWENQSSRTATSQAQLRKFRQVWNALVNSGFSLTDAYPSITGFSNKKDGDNMVLPTKLVRDYLISQDKADGIAPSNYALFGDETITTGHYLTSKKQRRVEIKIATVSTK